MKTISLIEIPYARNSLPRFQALLDLMLPVMLDSGQSHHEDGRYDIFTAQPLYHVQLRNGLAKHSLLGDTPVTQLTTYLNETFVAELGAYEQADIPLPFYGGFIGYASYDLGRYWENLPARSEADIDLPELQLAFYPWACVVDHVSRKAWLSFLPQCPADLKDLVKQRLSISKTKSIKLKKFNIIKELKSFFNVDSYSTKVSEIQSYIRAGDCYQVNFSQRYAAEYTGHPWIAYQAIRDSVSPPFSAYLSTDSRNLGTDNAILAFSPERFIRLEGGKVLTQPIKGTSKRFADPEKDAKSASALLASEKNRAENLMIVDLLRNDLGKCCEFGSVKTEKLFEIQSVTNVHHLVSSISADLSPGKSPFDLMEAVFPGGSITGAPKIRAMEIIDELEPSRRSIYCGSIFYINVNGDMDSNIAIRTVLCHNNKVYCWGGGGIVADSDPEAEYQESLDKIQPILRALDDLMDEPTD